MRSQTTRNLNVMGQGILKTGRASLRCKAGIAHVLATQLLCWHFRKTGSSSDRQLEMFLSFIHRQFVTGYASTILKCNMCWQVSRCALLTWYAFVGELLPPKNSVCLCSYFVQVASAVPANNSTAEVFILHSQPYSVYEDGLRRTRYTTCSLFLNTYEHCLIVYV